MEPLVFRLSALGCRESCRESPRQISQAFSAAQALRQLKNSGSPTLEVTLCPDSVLSNGHVLAIRDWAIGPKLKSTGAYKYYVLHMSYMYL